ncbi:MAG: group II intron reverse transcriptase/maturase [bacterium]
MNPDRSENKPGSVPETADPPGDVRSLWGWTEPAVWTDRMLTALEKGVRGGRWFCLIDKVFAPRTLSAAFAKVKANGGAAGVDNQTVAMVEERFDANLENLSDALRNGEYRPAAVKRVWIPKPGRKEKRPLGIPTVRDRIVQTALRSVLEPIFERDFAEYSYGFRPGRSCKDAMRRVRALINAGRSWALDADLKGFFDTIPHDKLMARIKEKVTDGSVLSLLGKFLTQTIKDGCEIRTPERGTPQGAVISPLLANIYLDDLDKLMASKGFEMVRYADDFVVLCRSEQDARAALAVVEAWTANAGLTLHPEKTRIMQITRKDGFDFLGYEFHLHKHRATKKAQCRLKDTIRSKTKRSNGHCLERIIADINPILRGWFEYFKHHQAKTLFSRLDSWIRFRIRSILWCRKRKRGRARGKANRTWTNAFFVDLGLFSLSAARETACQSVTR